MPDVHRIPAELDYILLLFALFVVPRLLERYRLPAAITAVVLGATAGLGFGLFLEDPAVQFFATLGIVSLFLFAGLDVDFHELRRETPVILQHVTIGVVTLVLGTLAAAKLFELPWRAGALVSLALFTPSTGFILDSLGTMGIGPRERFWVKSKAVAAELVALVAMLFTLQSASLPRLAGSVVILAAMVVFIPFVFRVFAEQIAPRAPKSEFAFLLMTGVLAAFLTRRLGVYYLLGAFVVGIAAQRFRAQLPAAGSERIVHALEVFASFFVPFYFFYAGSHLRREDLALDSLMMGLAFLVFVAPVRVGIVAAHRRAALGESWRQGARVGICMLPTLVFNFVIVSLLAENYAVPRFLIGGLIIYALGTTALPGFVLGLAPIDVGAWEEEKAPASQAEMSGDVRINPSET